MHERKSYIVDGLKCTSLAATAREFTRALELGLPWHGNLDAFNDFLRGGFGTPEDGFVLIWRHSDAARLGLGYDETAKWFEERSLNAHPSNRSAFLVELADARRQTGRTLFDMLVAIIEDHDDIDLQLT